MCSCLLVAGLLSGCAGTLPWRKPAPPQQTAVAQAEQPAPPPAAKDQPQWPYEQRYAPTAGPPQPYFPARPAAWQGAEELPMPQRPIHVPIDEPFDRDSVQIESADDRISLTAKEAPINAVLAMIAEQHGLNIVSGDEVSERISVKLTNVRLDDALNAILAVNGYSWAQHKNIVIVSKISAEKKSSPMAQGRQVRVFTLNYMTAIDADKVVKGLLSPVGQSFITSTASSDHRRTHEQLIVEDLPDYLTRVASYVRQADTPPRQVIIEAHVLQVQLKNNFKHGVNFKHMFEVANVPMSIESAGLATGASPGSMFKLTGAHLTALLEAIRATTDAKTLASPKIAVLNGQQAHMQVGSKIGYLLTTTTQTSSLQSVNFLDVGVILKVTPAITDDGQILMQVNPVVSTGALNPTNNLPQSDTTEVETRVLVADGEALVIGGLIKEQDSDARTRLLGLSDIWMIGALFQRREVTRERNEIIITLLPRIIPDPPGCRNWNPVEVQRAHTPLLYGPVLPVDRSQLEPGFDCFQMRPRHRQQYTPPDIYCPECNPPPNGPWRGESTPEQPPQPEPAYGNPQEIPAVRQTGYGEPEIKLSRLPPTENPQPPGSGRTYLR
jgi:hypothetical protein